MSRHKFMQKGGLFFLCDCTADKMKLFQFQKMSQEKREK